MRIQIFKQHLIISTTTAMCVTGSRLWEAVQGVWEEWEWVVHLQVVSEMMERMLTVMMMKNYQILKHLMLPKKPNYVV